jgi:hypothetical protein
MLLSWFINGIEEMGGFGGWLIVVDGGEGGAVIERNSSWDKMVYYLRRMAMKMILN